MFLSSSQQILIYLLSQLTFAFAPCVLIVYSQPFCQETCCNPTPTLPFCERSLAVRLQGQLVPPSLRRDISTVRSVAAVYLQERKKKERRYEVGEKECSSTLIVSVYRRLRCMCAYVCVGCVSNFKEESETFPKLICIPKNLFFPLFDNFFTTITSTL